MTAFDWNGIFKIVVGDTESAGGESQSDIEATIRPINQAEGLCRIG